MRADLVFQHVRRCQINCGNAAKPRPPPRRRTFHTWVCWAAVRTGGGGEAEFWGRLRSFAIPFWLSDPFIRGRAQLCGFGAFKGMIATQASRIDASCTA